MSPAWTIARRDMRRGGRGLILLAVCLFLGTASLAGIGSLSSAILSAIAGQGRAMLGGDLELRVSQRRATVEESAAFAERGKLSETIRLRGMAEGDGDHAPVLVDLRVIDHAYPLVGKLTMRPGAITDRPHGREVAIAPGLAERLGVGVGDSLHLGTARLRIVALIANLPDALGGGFSIGPSVLIDQAGLDATGLIQPGSLYEASYRLSLPPGSDAKAIGTALVDRFPSAGWNARTPDDAGRGLRRMIDQLGQFLLLVGLAALVIAGVGVGSGVGAYLAGKTRMIAMLKVLGARSGTIATVFAAELAMVAGLAIAAGLAIGAATPALVKAVAGSSFPVPLETGVYPLPLLTAAGLGVLVAVLFALPSLARAQAIPAASLLRDAIAQRRRPTARILVAMAGIVAALLALAVLGSARPLLALGFIGAIALLLALLWAIGLGIRWLVARLPRVRQPLIRIALANLHRPGAQTDRLVVALGLGFSLFVALAVIDSSLSREIVGEAPGKAPRFFALDVPAPEGSAFRATVLRAAPGATVETTPSLRGAVVAINGRRVETMKTIPENAWVLRGDRTLTWSSTVPPRDTVVAGRWWPADYRGPPLISIEDRAAEALGLKVGDRMTIAVLGVEVEARIAALRKVDWQGLGLAFAIVFSPGLIEEAPHALVGGLYTPAGTDDAVARAVAERFPAVTMIRVGDVIGQVRDIFARVAIAIRAAAGVTVAARIAVLAGAVIGSGAARRYDAVILKLLGARRRQVLAVQAIEYALLALLLAVVALGVGTAAGWYAATQVLEIGFAPDWGLVALTLAASIAITLGVGLLGSVPVLRARPAESLREL